MKKEINKKDNGVTSKLTDKTSFLDIIEWNLCRGPCKKCLFEYCAIRN